MKKITLQYVAITLIAGMALSVTSYASVTKEIKIQDKDWKVSFDPEFKTKLLSGAEVNGPYVTGADGMMGMKCNYSISTGHNEGVDFSAIPLGGSTGCIDNDKLKEAIELAEK